MFGKKLATSGAISFSLWACSSAAEAAPRSVGNARVLQWAQTKVASEKPPPTTAAR